VLSEALCLEVSSCREARGHEIDGGRARAYVFRRCRRVFSVDEDVLSTWVDTLIASAMRWTPVGAFEGSPRP
jgi:hypothetical protein